MNSCEYFETLISRMLDEDLSAPERAELARHIDRCPECSALYGAFASVSGIIANDLEEPPEELCVNVMARLRRQNIRAVKKPRIPVYWTGIIASAACLAVIIFAALGAQSKLTSRAETSAIYGGSVNARAETAVSSEDTAVQERIIEAEPVAPEESSPVAEPSEPAPSQPSAPSAVVIAPDDQSAAAAVPACPQTESSKTQTQTPAAGATPVPEILPYGANTEPAAANDSTVGINSMPAPPVLGAAADGATPQELYINDAAARGELIKLLSGKKAERPTEPAAPEYILHYYSDAGEEHVIELFMCDAKVYYYSYPALASKTDAVFHLAACTEADISSFIQAHS